MGRHVFSPSNSPHERVVLGMKLGSVDFIGMEVSSGFPKQSDMVQQSTLGSEIERCMSGLVSQMDRTSFLEEQVQRLDVGTGRSEMLSCTCQ